MTQRSRTLQVALLGLGEAGSAIASDLVNQGVTVRGWDPVVKDVPGVGVAASATEAVRGADVVLSINSAKAALEAAHDLASFLQPGQIFADCNTGSPALKEAVAKAVGTAGAGFVDVALMAPVPGKGLRTPVLVSGDSAGRFADYFRPLGMPIEIIDERPGSAAARKLLRSVFVKGLHAAFLEGLAAAQQLGWVDWYLQETGRTLQEFNESAVDRILQGSRRHAARRIEEMMAAAEFLLSARVVPRVSLAAAEILGELQRANTT